jgi:hypothetical protein
LIFLHGIVGVLALVSSDVRLQPNGYNLYVDRLPSVVNSLGVLMGFIGLLGIHDDKPGMVWCFNRYCAIKIVAMLVAAIADLVELQECENWKNSPQRSTSPRMDTLSQQELCPWARWSYVVGCVLDLGLWIYLFARCYEYENHIAANPPYAIDFGRETDVNAKWTLYKVSKPSYFPKAPEEEVPKFYGSTTVPHGNSDLVGGQPQTVPVTLPQPAGAQGAQRAEEQRDGIC